MTETTLHPPPRFGTCSWKYDSWRGIEIQTTTFADDSRRVLLKWGWMPHVMERGKAEISLKLDGGAKPLVHALKADGSRWGQIPSEFKDGRLSFTADTAHQFASATFMYKVVR